MDFGGCLAVVSARPQLVNYHQLGHKDISCGVFPGCADWQLGLLSATERVITEVIIFLLPGERTCPTELGRDKNVEVHKKMEGSS